jgi:hypothetical protein
MGWIPAFAGMTETSCQFVARIIPAHVFSKEHTKGHEVRKKRALFFFFYLRVLRALRGDIPSCSQVTSSR